MDTAKYYRQAEKELEAERLRREGWPQREGSAAADAADQQHDVVTTYLEARTDDSKDAFEESKDASEEPKDASEESKDASEESKDAFEEPKDASKESKDASKEQDLVR